MNKLKKYFFLGAIAAFLLQGCYVAFQHPQVDNYQWGQVEHDVDCSECHRPVTTPAVLPAGTQGDAWWDFYANSAWWEGRNFEDFLADKSTTNTVVEPPTVIEKPHPWPPGGGGYSGPVTTPIGGSLSKPMVSSEEETDNRRTSGTRRANTPSSDDSDSSTNSRQSQQRGSR